MCNYLNYCFNYELRIIEMRSLMDNKNLAVEILNIVDSNNIIQATNCMTRLRLQIIKKDSSIRTITKFLFKFIC